MDDYLSKPVDVADLLAMVEKWGALNASVPPSTPRALPPGEGATDTPVFDRGELVRRSLGDIGLSRDVVTIFIRSSQEYIESIRTATAAQDAAALRRLAHKLRGAAANLSLAPLSEIAAMIEAAAEGGDLDKTGKLLPELELRFGQAVDALKEMLLSP